MAVKTNNDFLLGSNGNVLQHTIPVRCETQEQAFRTAAWLVELAIVLPHEDEEATFEEVRAAVRGAFT